MATTTTNYGFDIPQSTDLVKDGATAIATLGQDIDTAMNTALGTKKAGMVLLNTTSFSAVSSVSLPADTFTATYQNYKVIVIVTQTNTTDLFFRLRTAGTDNSNASYGYQLVINDNTTLTGSRTGSNTGFAGYNQAASTNIFDITILRPQETQKTNIISNATLLADGTSIRSAFANGLFNATTSFDSFSTIVSAGTISGTMYAYGLAK
jgi:hypothetical protein